MHSLPLRVAVISWAVCGLRLFAGETAAPETPTNVADAPVSEVEAKPSFSTPTVSGFGVRYAGISASRDNERFNVLIGRRVAGSTSFNLPIAEHWDVGFGYTYTTYSQLPSLYENSILGEVAYHRRYGRLTPYILGGAAASRAHLPFQGDQDYNYDYGWWHAAVGVEYIPLPRVAINLGAGAGDLFAAGDDLSFSGSIAGTLWIWGPLGLRASSEWGENGERSKRLEITSRFRF